ncbi:hypothetical protein CDAR_425061 [Caerostris darwini]|uniref:Uncharacterized protein n=1 Tax=Caerostris darwini TaxID=1538125 RepID=A0AAV4XA29_9ARAC|nr:hypothetical protein CDAR_425061 [Caerostris darwini]
MVGKNHQQRPITTQFISDDNRKTSVFVTGGSIVNASMLLALWSSHYDQTFCDIMKVTKCSTQSLLSCRSLGETKFNERYQGRKTELLDTKELLAAFGSEKSLSSEEISESVEWELSETKSSQSSSPIKPFPSPSRIFTALSHDVD